MEPPQSRSSAERRSKVMGIGVPESVPLKLLSKVSSVSNLSGDGRSTQLGSGELMVLYERSFLSSTAFEGSM